MTTPPSAGTTAALVAECDRALVPDFGNVTKWYIRDLLARCRDALLEQDHEIKQLAQTVDAEYQDTMLRRIADLERQLAALQDDAKAQVHAARAERDAALARAQDNERELREWREAYPNAIAAIAAARAARGSEPK
jgi:hypothetical protein